MKNRASVAVLAAISLYACMSASAELGRDWTLATAAASWSGRYEHASVVHNNNMWVIAGFDFYGWKNDVWRSSDGITWTAATLSASWSPREYPSAVSFAGKMWVIGGYAESPRWPTNDVWYSSDGVKWTSATLSARWSPRHSHTSVVHNGKIWVIGGRSRDGDLWHGDADVWCSVDGVMWTSATESAPWGPRGLHTSVVYESKMWVIGGGAGESDVWYSSDGEHWTAATLNAPWGPRTGHTSVVCDGKIWVMGGIVPYNGWYNDVWYSSDGVNWRQATASAPWGPHDGHTSVVFNDRIWVIGGYEDMAWPFVFKNDVWHSEGTITRATSWWRY